MHRQMQDVFLINVEQAQLSAGAAWLVAGRAGWGVGGGRRDLCREGAGAGGTG